MQRQAATLNAGDIVPVFRASTPDGTSVTIGASALPDARQVLFLFRTTCP